MPEVFCVIPAYNEERNIKRVVDELKLFDYKIIVVDDGSTDNTYNVAKSCGVIVLRHLINRGQGAALQTGDEYALAQNAGIIVHFDADGQFMAEEITEMIAPLKNNEADIVFGSRFLEKASAIPGTKKFFLLPLARVFNSLFFGVKLTDPQSGLRALTARAARSITIEHDGMAHCSEIIAKAFANNYRIKEIPIRVIYKDYGQKFSGGLKIIKDLLINKILN